VLFPVPAGVAAELARHRVAVTAGDLASLGDLAAATAAAATAAAPNRPGRRRLEVHLEVETGLGRGGLRDDELVRAAAAIAAAPGLRLAGLWTHLQAAEDADRTAAQVERLDEASEELRLAGHRAPTRHLAASGALLLGEIVALDGVRPGLAVYGLVPDELLGRSLAAGRRLRPVMSLHARPVRVADLPAGWGISYGPSFVTQRPSRIATLPLGYGDGWPRLLSNRAVALVRGQRVPLVGTVAMDAVMADVTDVAGPQVTAQDEFVLLGSQAGDAITAADLAAARSTSSWEVVTDMAARLPRVYDASSGARGLRTLVSGPGPAIDAPSRRRTDRS
jgi:alanine racemase